MQIIINTAEMLGDETTIRDEVIDQVSNALIKAFSFKVEEVVNDIFRKQIEKVASEAASRAATLHLDTEIIPVDSYGRKEAPTTVRNTIADIVKNSCQYKKTSYSSDRNRFTESVDDIVRSETKKFQTEYNSMINKELIKSCQDYAAKKLRDACGII